LKLIPLDETALGRAARLLARRDPDLAEVLRLYGVPPLWAREPGFGTLVHLVLEQQVSLASARAAFERLRALVPDLSPAGFLALSGATLRAIGFSRQKAGYCRALAHAIVAGELDLPALALLDDEAVHGSLTRLKGIGTWTANIYLLMALRRPDVFPAGDLALLVAAHRIKRLRRRPTPERLLRLAEQWRPYRSVAARLLWQYYLNAPRLRARRP
jgi:DNA-3-methyladenine glycosylase II